MRTIAIATIALSILAKISFAQDDSNNRFAIDFLKQVAKNEKGNVFFSPFSLSSAMGMTFAGSKDLSEVQIGKVFHFPANSPEFHKKLGKTIKRISSKKDSIKLNIVNTLWAEKTYPIKESYTKLIKKSYSAEIMPMDFLTHFEESRKTINENIYKSTNEKIKDLLPPGSLNSLTKLVLTNAIYFKGNWNTQFIKEQTVDDIFFSAPQTPVKCKMMSVKGNFNYYEDPNLEVIEMPYAGNNFSMLIFLPASNIHLEEIIHNLTFEQVVYICDNLYNQEIRVNIPKIKFEKGYQLKGILSKMGMPNPFSDNANFTGMSQFNNLKITDVFHKAFIEVNEQGSEAAAATAVVIGIKSISREKLFRADRPFLFVIKEKTTNTILFMGKVGDPTKAE